MNDDPVTQAVGPFDPEPLDARAASGEQPLAWHRVVGGKYELRAHRARQQKRREPQGKVLRELDMNDVAAFYLTRLPDRAGKGVAQVTPDAPDRRAFVRRFRDRANRIYSGGAHGIQQIEIRRTEDFDIPSRGQRGGKFRHIAGRPGGRLRCVE